jgi:hypothetical protein
MADPAKIMARVRALGANVVIDGGGLKIINGKKLPADALAFIKQHAGAIADWLDREGEFEERAAIIEFDGHTPREWAEQFAKLLISMRPQGVSDLDWSWFINRAGNIIDEAPMARAA